MNYKKLQEELETRRATREDIEAIGRENPIVCAALHGARINNQSIHQALLSAVAYLAISNHELMQQAIQLKMLASNDLTEIRT